MIIIDITVVCPVSRLKRVWQINIQKKQPGQYAVWAYNHEKSVELDLGLVQHKIGEGLEELTALAFVEFFKAVS